MNLGAKSLASGALLVVAVAVAWSAERLRFDYLARLDPNVTYAVGLLVTLAAGAVYRFWRLDAHSLHGFSFSSARFVTDGEKWDLPPWAHPAIYVLAFSCIGLVTIDNRAIALLLDFPRRISQAGDHYCPEGSTTQEPDDANRAGCELVRRAVRLGYAKSLGSCEPKARIETAELCELRHRDEPYLHYAWRLLSRTFDDANPTEHLDEMMRDFTTRRAHQGSLLGAQRDALLGAPRSAHLVFTDLPDPRAGVVDRTGAALVPGRCEQRFRRMPHLLRDASDGVTPSLVVEHALGQLLFNPRYRPVVADCREYHIRWGAPVDACRRLASDPESFLRSMGLLDDVRAILERRERRRIVERIANPTASPAPHEHVVSFQCLTAGAAGPLEQHTVELDGATWTARAIHAPVETTVRGQIATMRAMATLFAPGFAYGRLVSQESVGGSEDGAETMARALQEPRFALTKLDLLRDADLFLGNTWIDGQPHVLDVYPYHLHLKNFVELFRSRYTLARGRL